MIPKRILTGVPAQHLYLDIMGDKETLTKQLDTLKKLEINVFFVIADTNAISQLMELVS